ncbi:jg17390 [Pararge aegeria aegeria]|uniref:Jg17390 protein n=1 Tax=Pararge aegeria aegeria TaxID=348720 RepID=A0A8S4RWR6_9NEOP|nr:jg17390 [Pararge aegeria aegeria]
MDVGVPRCCSGDLAPVNAAFVDPRQGGQMTSDESESRLTQAAQDFSVYPTKKPMSSSRCQSVDMMMIDLEKFAEIAITAETLCFAFSDSFNPTFKKSVNMHLTSTINPLVHYSSRVFSWSLE